MEEDVKGATTEAMETATVWNPVPLKRYADNRIEIAVGFKAPWRDGVAYVVSVGENIHSNRGADTEKVGYESAVDVAADGWLID